MLQATFSDLFSGYRVSGDAVHRGRCKLYFMISPEELVGEEWAAWYRLSPVKRWRESEHLWQVYFYLGGSLDTQPDTQSPFFDPRAPRTRPSHGLTGMRILRRSRV